MDTAHIFSVIDNLNEHYCGLWEQVCNMDSPTDCKQGVDAVGQVFIQIANQHLWAVEISRQKTAGNPICITMNPQSPEHPIVFSGHIDTVYPPGTFPAPAVRRQRTDLRTRRDRLQGRRCSRCHGHGGFDALRFSKAAGKTDHSD